jgi:hypothetical protein
VEQDLAETAEGRSYVLSLHVLGADSLMQPPSCNLMAYQQWYVG